MSSIPLPALDLKTPQQPDVFGDVSKLIALKSMMGQQQMQQQELQIRQQQVQDQQATTKAMKNWDGQDYDSLAKSVLQNGGSAQAAQAVQQHGLTVKKTVSDIAAQDATTGSKNLETFIGRHKAIGDALEGIENVPDDQLHQKALDTIGQLTKSGILDPQSAQQLAQGVQQAADPKTLRDQIDVFAKSSMGAKAVADQQKTQAETGQANAKAGLDQAQTWLETNKANVIKAYQQNPQQLLSQIDAIAPPDGPNAALNARTKSRVQFALSNGDVDGAKDVLKQAAEQVGAVEKDVQVATNPQIQAGKVEVARNTALVRQQAQAGQFGQQGDPMIDMVGQNRIDLATALQRVPPAQKDTFLRNLSAAYPDFNQGTFGVAKKEETAFTSGSQGQQLTAIGTARNHMQTFKDTADALDNGNVLLANKVGNAIGMQFGSDKATNFNIARSAFAGEVGKAFAGANVGVQDRQELIDKINAASSPAQLKGYADTADALLAGKQKSLKDSYESGVKGKPNFGSDSQHVPGGQAGGLKEGQTGTGSDKKKYVVKNGVWVAQ